MLCLPSVSVAPKCPKTFCYCWFRVQLYIIHLNEKHLKFYKCEVCFSVLCLFLHFLSFLSWHVPLWLFQDFVTCSVLLRGSWQESLSLTCPVHRHWEALQLLFNITTCWLVPVAHWSDYWSKSPHQGEHQCCRVHCGTSSWKSRAVHSSRRCPKEWQVLKPLQGG